MLGGAILHSLAPALLRTYTYDLFDSISVCHVQVLHASHTSKLYRARSIGWTMADDDDLDAFFDEVSAVEAEVKDQEVKDGDKEKESTLVSTEPSPDDKEKPKPNHSTKTPTSTQEEESGLQPPPAKRVKTMTATDGKSTPTTRPVGVVVASATSVISAPAVPAIAGASPAITIIGPSFSNDRSTTNPTTMFTKPPISSHSFPIPNHQHPPLPPGLPPMQGQQQVQSAKPRKRSAAGKSWVDPTLDQWPENDFRIFVGNIAKDISEQQLHEHFSKKYNSAVMAKIVRDAQGASKGYGFVSFLEPMEMARSLREMDQTWLNSRPIRVKRSDWKDRDLKNVKKKEKNSKKQQRRKGW